VLLNYMEGQRSHFICPEGHYEQASLDVAGFTVNWPGMTSTGYGPIPCDDGHPRCMQVSSGPDYVEFAFEDWVDADWNDIWLKFTTLPDGNLEIKVTQKESGNNFDVKDPSGQTIPGLIGLTNSSVGTAVTVPGGAGGEYSYGMSAVAHRIDVDERKIVMLDYGKLVADVVGVDAADVWSITSAPRHHGVCNALFSDGSVLGLAAGQVDPTISALHDKLWCPRKVTPLGP
jgi:hypothetical protein